MQNQDTAAQLDWPLACPHHEAMSLQSDCCLRLTYVHDVYMMQVQGNAAWPHRASASPGQPLPRRQCAHHLRWNRNGAGPLHQSQTGQAPGLRPDTICLAVAPHQATVSDLQLPVMPVGAMLWVCVHNQDVVLDFYLSSVSRIVSPDCRQIQQW